MADPLEQGIAALRAGDNAKARHHLSLAVQQAPTDTKAWLWLSGAMESDEDRLKCLKRVLLLDPSNEAAKRGVAELQKRVPGRKPATRPGTSPFQTEVSAPAAPPPRQRTRRKLEVKGAESMQTCKECGAEIESGRGVRLQPGKKGSIPEIMCAKCADETERAYLAEGESPNLIGGLLAGLVAAMAASAIWFGVVALSKCQIAYVAIAVGGIVGAAVVAGSGGKRGAPLQIISVLITLIAMGISEYLIVRYFVIVELGAEGTGWPLFTSLETVLDYIGAGIETEPITLLFWGIALFAAWSVPAKRRLRRA